MTKIISIILIITLVPTLSISYSPLPSGERIKVRGNIGTSIAYAEEKFTPYTPETEEPEPKKEEVKKEKKGGVSWLWIVVGIVAVGGGVAVAAGGGGSSGERRVG